MRRPSGLHAGLAYWSAWVVRRVGAARLPARKGTFHTAPPRLSLQVVKAIHRPSLENAGAYSSRSPSVTRRGWPLGRDMLQMRPTAWKSRVRPSGEIVGQRITRARKVSPVSSDCGK